MTSRGSSSRTNNSSAASFHNYKHDSISGASSLRKPPSRHISGQVKTNTWSSDPPLRRSNSWGSQREPKMTIPRSHSHPNDLQQGKSSGTAGSWVRRSLINPSLTTAQHPTSRQQPSGSNSSNISMEQQRPISHDYSQVWDYVISNRSTLQNSKNMDSFYRVVDDMIKSTVNSTLQQYLTSKIYSHEEILNNMIESVVHSISQQHSNTSSPQLSGSNSNNISIEQQSAISYYSKAVWDYVMSNRSTLQNSKNMASFYRVVDDMIKSTHYLATIPQQHI